jgi:hypothetical protein
VPTPVSPEVAVPQQNMRMMALLTSLVPTRKAAADKNPTIEVRKTFRLPTQSAKDDEIKVMHAQPIKNALPSKPIL